MIGAAERKGLSALGSADALHPRWRHMWAEASSSAEEHEMIVVPSAEVEDKNRVHHLILMEEFASFSELHAILEPFGKDLSRSGRPRIRLGAGEIAQRVHDLGGLIGPAHAFTPWTSLYASHDTVKECYGEEPIDFLELGLSADSSYGASIPELYGIPFLSSSDAHGPDPGRLGREFVVLEVRELTPAGILESIAGAQVVRNAGLFPEEGKYNRTACSRCFRQYTLEEATGLGWKCPQDNGRIKKGVVDRARELSRGAPHQRPPYLHLIPLPDIIRHVLSRSSSSCRDVRTLYERFLSTFGDEISVLTTIPVPDLAQVHEGTARAIDSLRCGRVSLSPGGGGRYGTFSFS
ncbi:MAG: hypothetical protein A4E42_00028 [Methanoregulaceae archaeon PtaU1.Bin222]|nr:MAG: hypothetical protein A4E42_00028 [Methanoregulaceae archaeon PtaU1.Bin222]